MCTHPLLTYARVTQIVLFLSYFKTFLKLKIIILIVFIILVCSSFIRDSYEEGIKWSLKHYSCHHALGDANRSNIAEDIELTTGSSCLCCNHQFKYINH